MHIIHFLLSMYICTLCNPLHVAATDAVSSAQLLPDDLFAFNHYEVLSIREEGDEDVVRIRKRAGQEDCGTDCLDYSGWTENELMNCDVENVDAEDTAGEDVPGENTKLIQNYEMVYDTGDPTEPLKKEWFELQGRKKRWTKDLVGRQPQGKNPNRCYAAEHVLEWQLLKAFINADKDKKDESRCALLLKYFNEPIPIADHNVKVGKDKGKLGTDNHFEYEDKEYAFAFQWPGTAGGHPPNPWEYELVLLNQDANLKKANVWAGHNLFTKPTVDKNNKMRENQENSGTLEWLFENKYYQDKKVKTWPDNKGKCKAIYQVLLAGATYKGPGGPPEIYKERGLKKEWLDWMKETHKIRLDALTETMNEKLEVFKNNPSVITKLKRWDYSGIFGRAVETANCGFEKDSKKLDKRVDLLIDAYKNMRQVESELKLD
ncbi:hypothetical protein BKA66DRAFT_433113 [Pyrenochaeta sp. MPI-SDFR-AT-0127]|nr:hypothetical protein BKA66DRAFT_433113 [Pyrenochaeta sp. MPI-SDFR-AT-0127]